MRTALTKRVIAQSLPQARPYEIRDGQTKGLILRVQPSGHKAFIVTWAHGRRRTLGSVEHVTLEQARAQAVQAVADAVADKLPALAKSERQRCTLDVFLTDHYGPWARAELRRGDRYVHRIRTVLPTALGLALNKIDAGWVDRWCMDRITSGVTKATASRDLACLRSALSKAVEWKLLDMNPLLGLRNRTVESRKVVRFLSSDETLRLRTALQARDTALIAARESGNAWRAARRKALLPVIPANGFGDHLTPLVLLAMNTGLRRGELLALTWEDIALQGAMLTVRAEIAKSGKQRHVPLNAEALDVLVRWRAQSAAGRVFGVDDCKNAWRNLLAAAQIERFRFHDLRHHFASRLVSQGVDINTVRVLLGHADIKMTLRYAHLAPEHLVAAVSKLAG